MKAVHLLGLCTLLATPAYGQYAAPQPAPAPQIDWSRGQYKPPASTNRIPILDTIPKTPITNTPTAVIRPAGIVPRSSVPPAAAPNAYSAAAENIDKVKKSAEGGVDTGKVLGIELDPTTQRRMDQVIDGVGVVQHGLGAYGAYRAEGAEGMLAYGIQEGGEQVLDNVVERAFPTYAPAWRLGRLAGDVIKENVKINGQTIESHVTNLYFHVLEGRAVDQAFELNTSDGAIELHRQKLRRQREAQFSSMSRSNEQAAANRAAQAAQASAASDNAAYMNEMMLMMTPALISASQERRQPTLAPAIPVTPAAMPSSGYRDPRRVDTAVPSSGSFGAFGSSGSSASSGTNDRSPVMSDSCPRRPCPGPGVCGCR